MLFVVGLRGFKLIGGCLFFLFVGVVAQKGFECACWLDRWMMAQWVSQELKFLLVR